MIGEPESFIPLQPAQTVDRSLNLCESALALSLRTSIQPPGEAVR
jgi:hypothetical protein